MSTIKKRKRYFVAYNDDIRSGKQYYRVFEVKDDMKLYNLGMGYYYHCSTRGLDSEVMTWLADNGYIGAEYKNSNLYYYEMAKKEEFEIQTI